MNAAIERQAFKDGLRYAQCSNCGMGWIEHEEQLEGFLPPGPRGHECPEPFDRQTAEALLSYHVETGVPTSSRIKARIKLGLREAGQYEVDRDVLPG